MLKSEISAVINAHHEGLLARASLLSLKQAIEHARIDGATVEAIAVLDRPDSLTLEIFENFSRDYLSMRILTVDYGDLGRSRNAGVAAAEGRWIAFLDSDDLWGANWLSKARRAAESDGRSIVWHPEANVYFGVRPHIFPHVDMESTAYVASSLAVANYWTALCFTEKALLLKVPYRPSDLSCQIGYEDWHWNMEVIAHGALHKIVSGTGHAIRTKRASLVQSTNAAGCNVTATYRAQELGTAQPAVEVSGWNVE